MEKYVYKSGNGTRVRGVPFNTINWESDNYTLRAEVDVLSDGSYETISEKQLLSVPYALRADELSQGGSIPIRGIIMWSGSQIPNGWALCNGQIVNNIRTPKFKRPFYKSQQCIRYKYSVSEEDVMK